jgi:hypothetical protein
MAYRRERAVSLDHLKAAVEHRVRVVEFRNDQTGPDRDASPDQRTSWIQVLTQEKMKKSSFSNTLFFTQTECFLFLFPVINRLITPAAAAIIAEHAKTNSSSSAILKRGQFLVFRIKSIT